MNYVTLKRLVLASTLVLAAAAPNPYPEAACAWDREVAVVGSIVRLEATGLPTDQGFSFGFNGEPANNLGLTSADGTFSFEWSANLNSGPVVDAGFWVRQEHGKKLRLIAHCAVSIVP